MKDNNHATMADTEVEAWITLDKNRFELEETIYAVLNWGHKMRPDNLCHADRIKVVLTDPVGNIIEIAPVNVDETLYNITSHVKSAGAYSLTAVCESICLQDDNNINPEAVQKSSAGIRRSVNYLLITSACFLVGDCKVAVPKVPDTKTVLVPEKWEIPGFYKLISVCLKKDGQPAPYAPVTLVFGNCNGYLERELKTDKYGNVFFIPYMTGTYCLINKTTLDEAISGVCDSTKITAAFSFSLHGHRRSRSRSELTS